MSEKLLCALESNIIVKMPNWLGDLVMATPVLADLRQARPYARITAMCSSLLAPMLQKNPHIDEVFSYKRPQGLLDGKQHRAIIKEIKKGHYDIGLLLTGSFSSAWWLWQGGVKCRIGYAGNMRSWLLSKSLAIPLNRECQHLVKTYKQLLHPLNISVSTTRPYLCFSAEEKALAKERFLYAIEAKDPLILGVNPGAAYGSAKCWLPERFVAVTKKMLQNPRVYVVYFGDKAGCTLVNTICQELPKERVINLAGKTSLRELGALISMCSLMLTNDSGPMHVAAALNIPLVALFGSTNDIATGPYQWGTVIHKHVACSPCYKRICPIDFKCMKKIEVEEVFFKLQALVKEHVGAIQ